MRALIAVQLAIIAAAAVGTVLRFPIFALVDEKAHVSYVEVIADHHRLPVVGADRVTPTLQALAEGVYPRPPRHDPLRATDLGAFSYEAFQPPAYHVAAAPLFLLSSSLPTKVRLLRAFDALLLAATLALLWLLAREVAPTRAGPLYAFALTAMMWPGVVVRSVTVSNAAAEMALGAALALLLWRAHARRDPATLLAAGALLGVGLLTRLTLACFVPVLVVVAVLAVRRDGRRALPVALAAVAAPAVMLVPWLVFNLNHFDALTPERIVRRMQEPVLNPGHRRFGLADLWPGLRTLLRGVLPEEWWVEYLHASRRWAADIFGALFLLGPLALAWRLPRSLRGRALGLLAVPGLLVVAGAAYALLAANWPGFLLPRYFYPELGAFALFAALVWRRVLGRRVLSGLTVALTVAAGLLWLHLTTVHPFTTA